MNLKLSVVSCLTYPHVGKLSNLPMRGDKQLALFSIEIQGSHSSWKTLKTWKNGDSFSSLEKSWNFVIFAKYPGKMRQTLEI